MVPVHRNLDIHLVAAVHVEDLSDHTLLVLPLHDLINKSMV